MTTPSHQCRILLTYIRPQRPQLSIYSTPEFLRNDYETLPLNCASYHVHTAQLKRSVETLERGRALIWSEMRGLRSSIDQLRASDPDFSGQVCCDQPRPRGADLDLVTEQLW